MRYILFIVFLVSSCAIVDPYFGKQRCGCAEDGSFACLYNDGDGIDELVISGYCAADLACSVEPMETEAGDEVYCGPFGGQ